MKTKSYAEETLMPGFDDPIMDRQKTYETVLSAIKQPGRIETLCARLRPPAGINRASAAVCLAFLDSQTPIWVNKHTDSAAKQWLKLRCGATVVKTPEKAALALINAGNGMPSPELFYPSLKRQSYFSTTMIIQVNKLHNKGDLVLSGPELQSDQYLSAGGLTREFLKIRNKLSSRFSGGVDMLLTSGHKLVALSRTTFIQ